MQYRQYSLILSSIFESLVSFCIITDFETVFTQRWRRKINDRSDYFVVNVRLNASYSYRVYDDHERNRQLAFQAHNRHCRFEREWREAEMRNHKNSWQEMNERETRIQDALRRHMTAQKRVRKCTETVTRIREKRSSSAWMQTGQTGSCRHGSMIVDYFVRREDTHVLDFICSDKFSNFYSVSTTLPSINLCVFYVTVVRRRIDVVFSSAIVSTCLTSQ